MSAFSTWHALILLLIGPLFGVVGFLPSIVAAHRRASSAVAVVWINAALGWTVVGWIVALVLALTSPAQDKA